MSSGRVTGFWGAVGGGLASMLLLACGDSDPPDLVRKTIGPAGGLISSYDDVLTVVLQPGALSSEVDIEIFPSDLPPPIFGPAYRVRPDIPLEVDAEVIYRRVLPSNANAALVGAIRRDDYEAQMGHWVPLPRLALEPEQQWVIAADDRLSLYYGLLEDGDAPPLPSTTGDDLPPGDSSGDSGTTSGPPSTDSGDSGTTSVDPTTTTGPPGTTDDGPPGTTDDGPGSTSTPGTDTMGMGSDDGMVMPVCSDGMPQAGELCLVAGADYAAGLAPIDVGVGNFDADPALDVVILELGALEVGLLPGAGDGTLLALAGGAAVGAAPAELSVGDFSGDGVLDVAVLDTVADSIGLLAGNGAGGFGALVSTPAGAGLVDLYDANFDGNAARDLAVLNATDGTVQLMLGSGAGFVAGASAMVGVGVDATVAAGSLNPGSDANDDVLGLGAGGYHAWATNGTGTFVGDISGAFGGGGTFVELVTGDIDGDGNPDVVALDVAGDAMVVGLSTGGPATFVFGAPVAAGVDPADVVLADLDGDGDLDAVVCNSTSNDVMIFEWNAGAYALAFSFPTGATPRGVAVGDLSGDGVPDVVVANQGSDTVTVVLSDP